MAKSATAGKAPTKSEIFGTIAEKTGLSKKQARSAVEALQDLAAKSLKKNGIFALPGLCRMVVRRKPASKAREGVNPFTGEKIMIKAKPASKTVRIRPLKSLKESVA